MEYLNENCRFTRHQSSKSASDTDIPLEVRPRLYCFKNISSNYGPILKVISIYRPLSPRSARMGRVGREISEISGCMHQVRGMTTPFCQSNLTNG